MYKSINLDDAKYRSGLAMSLYEVIMSIAAKEECSIELRDLIALACDINQEINRSLGAALNSGGEE
ncbi:hypothetical protein GPY51_22790 [Photorhabdus laumondii subsp. laumondii]|uniref:Uncharacterized protein n=1 Tax=Photorhabdus laumondii subsp. laumondii TaxID=141679 RepID=A0A6L9JXM9_PHOLM|nr:hypothetical protein [Photorhabdus laumondii]MCC8386506.1 hypothetical protein [Photorhabdus laumondii]MCC8414809.1 hypothetical protein [Photorhabdus laumondii]NDK97109.1 hypothetical protein [Photorhabdus laumondii subsp. laumondii]NDL21933.1 hypothetical protein [Photorhabdus laumondii subsp. laumondii]NDL31320.1 hypothetical protein [Photorhabdus laumondii subsp. laumondii]